MSRASSFVLFVVMCGAAVGAALARDIVGLQLLLAAVAVTAVAAIFVISADARAAVAGRAPRVAWLGRRVMALRWRTIAGSVAGCLSLFVAAEVWERVAYPRGRLGDHLIAAYGADLRDPRPPLLVGADLERSWPADDERYTAVGVVLRYEHDIVALLPDRSGGTRIVREDPVRGYRRFYPYVGDFWGGRYDHRDAVAPSALPVPSDADVAAVERRLADAQRVQRVCFGWDVEIRSGRRKGWFTGPPAEERGQPFLRLVGWIDPDAGRFRRHGSPGTWDLGYESNVPDGRLPPDSVKAINVRKIELMEGKSQTYGGGGVRAGKGLLEYLDVMPLLAAEMPGVPPVPPPPEVPATSQETVRPAATRRTDPERRAERSWLALPPAVARVAAGFTLVFVGLAAAAGAAARMARKLRDVRWHPTPPG